MGQVLDLHCIDKKTKVTERLCYLPKVIEQQGAMIQTPGQAPEPKLLTIKHTACQTPPILQGPSTQVTSSRKAVLVSLVQSGLFPP